MDGRPLVPYGRTLVLTALVRLSAQCYIPLATRALARATSQRRVCPALASCGAASAARQLELGRAGGKRAEGVSAAPTQPTHAAATSAVGPVATSLRNVRDLVQFPRRRVGFEMRLADARLCRLSAVLAMARHGGGSETFAEGAW